MLFLINERGRMLNIAAALEIYAHDNDEILFMEFPGTRRAVVHTSVGHLRSLLSDDETVFSHTDWGWAN